MLPKVKKPYVIYLAEVIYKDEFSFFLLIGEIAVTFSAIKNLG